MTGTLLTWLGLVACLAAELAAAATHRGWVAWWVAPVMVALIAANFMQLRRASSLSRIFAAAGLFWIVVMFGLGSADYLSRHDTPSGSQVGVDPLP